MATVKKLVERMGGDISVESSEGEGTAFRISLAQHFKDNGQCQASGFA